MAGAGFFQFIFLLLFFPVCLLRTPAYSKNLENSDMRCIERERQALLTIKKGLTGIDELSSWNSRDKDCCRWARIACDNTTGHVTMLDLSAPPEAAIPNLNRGEISPSLLELKYLNHLDISRITLDAIPKFIGSLSQLNYLNLSYNIVRGSIPYQLGDLSALETLDIGSLSISDLYAENPEWLSRLSSLKFLRFSGITFNGTTDWLNVVRKLPSLTSFHLFFCNFTEEVDASRLSLVKPSRSLKFVSITDNDFHDSAIPWLFRIASNPVEMTLCRGIKGRIPDSFETMTSLVHLDLRDNQLEGGIPKSLGNACRLKTLDISWNNLSESFPAILQNLSGCARNSLEILALNQNKLTGSLHDITSFPSLKELYLDRNQVEGTLPNTFDKLTKLEVLKVKENKLSGSFPISIGSVSTLRILDVSGNNLSGTISGIELSNLFNLQELDLSFNILALDCGGGWTPPFQLNTLELSSLKLGPRFPSWLQTQKNISRIDISNSGISDQMPNWFWNVFSQNLRYVNLSSNHISGEIPDLPVKVKDFLIIDLSSNLFGGRIPMFFSNASFLDISKNRFSGAIPFLCTKVDKPLSFLDLSDNLLSGELPDCFGHLAGLGLLNLANNDFYGKIPVSLGSLTRIESLRLSNNRFTGLLPSSLRNCTRLKLLDLRENKLTGLIPTWLGQSLTSLIVLQLKSNEFYGFIPLSICHLSYLRVLDLSLNNLSGTIPSCFNNLTAMSRSASSDHFTISYFYAFESVYLNGKNFFLRRMGLYYDSASVVWKGVEREYKKTLGLLKVIDISSNRLAGEIPEEITSLSELKTLNLSRNTLTGSIPNNIGRLKALESLDISRNKISGQIPSSLSEISFLSYLDLSFNELAGRIPSGTQLQGFNGYSYAGNVDLCGKPLDRTCPGDETRQEIPNAGGSNDENDEGWPESLCWYMGIGVGFFAGFGGLFVTLIFNSSWRYGYLQFLNLITDRICLAVALGIAKFRRTA